MEGDSRQDSLDLTGLDTFVDNGTKTVHKVNQAQQARTNVAPTPKQPQAKDNKPVMQGALKPKVQGKNLGAHIFDCDVSEIPANRQNRTGINEGSRASNITSHRLVAK